MNNEITVLVILLNVVFGFVAFVLYNDYLESTEFLEEYGLEKDGYFYKLINEAREQQRHGFAFCISFIIGMDLLFLGSWYMFNKKKPLEGRKNL